MLLRKGQYKLHRYYYNCETKSSKQYWREYSKMQLVIVFRLYYLNDFIFGFSKAFYTTVTFVCG